MGFIEIQLQPIPPTRALLLETSNPKFQKYIGWHGILSTNFKGGLDYAFPSGLIQTGKLTKIEVENVYCRLTLESGSYYIFKCLR